MMLCVCVVLPVCNARPRSCILAIYCLYLYEWLMLNQGVEFEVTAAAALCTTEQDTPVQVQRTFQEIFARGVRLSEPAPQQTR
jgi:hypothetical protein